MIKRIIIIDYAKNLLRKMIYGERSAHKLALSFSMGIFIAFSPYIGFHNIMIFVFSWIFKLNILTTFMAAHINNPLTTIPFLTASYFFGGWILNDLFKYPITCGNPHFINYINGNLTYYFGIPKICFWTFFIGANLLGLLVGILCYPIMKFVFTKFMKQSARPECPS